MIRGTTKIFFMIAHPIEHVRSPEVFNPLFQARGVDAVMVPVHFHPDDLATGWEAMRKMRNLGGIIISVPLKEAAYRLSDESDHTAVEVCAANTVRRESDGRMVCANFDGPGFLAGLLKNGRDVTGKHALLVGAGGAGAAIAFALAKSGVASIRVADTIFGKAERLVAAVKTRYPELEIMAGAADLSGRNLIVNATPCGLHPDTDLLPVAVDELTADMIVADIIMKPQITPLLAAAERAGCDVRYGAGMLDMQAELIMRFFGR
jgi:shikimate dehydrogenase